MKSKYHENQGDFHVGKILKSYIDKHKIAKSALARKIKRGDSTVIHYQKSASIQISIVNELCHALKHNFFADLAVQLPPTYTTNAPADSTQKDRIAALEQENTILKAKNEALMEALKGTTVKNNSL